LIRALLAAVGVGAAAYLVTRRRSILQEADVATFLIANAPRSALPYVNEVARAAIQTCPRDYYPKTFDGEPNADGALLRWALLLCAVGDHESAFATAPGYEPKGDPTGWGDRGNAFGLFQIDRRYHWTFIQSAAAQTIYGQALYAAKILADNFDHFSNVTDPGEREQLAVITYNASRARISQMLQDGATVAAADATTTKTAAGVPYGADVLSRIVGIGA
jgi:hypothetical protein